MSDLTPETLRGLANSIRGHSVHHRDDEHAFLVDLHASAWIADRKTLGAAIATLNYKTKRLDEAEARIEELERRERVGDRMHDFLCRLFSNPRLLPESFAPEAWTLMQDWTAPPPEAALRGEEER